MKSSCHLCFPALRMGTGQGFTARAFPTTPARSRMDGRHQSSLSPWHQAAPWGQGWVKAELGHGDMDGSQDQSHWGKPGSDSVSKVKILDFLSFFLFILFFIWSNFTDSAKYVKIHHPYPYYMTKKLSPIYAKYIQGGFLSIPCLEVAWCILDTTSLMYPFYPWFQNCWGKNKLAHWNTRVVIYSNFNSKIECTFLKI